MAGKSSARPRRGVDEDGRPEALAYWHQQERAALGMADASPGSQDAPSEGAQMPGGWWILPAALLSVAAWAALAALVL